MSISGKPMKLCRKGGTSVTMETPKLEWVVASTVDGRLLSFNELADMADRNAAITRCDDEEACHLFMGANTDVVHSMAKPRHRLINCVSVDLSAVAIDIPFGKFVRPGIVLDDWKIDRVNYRISGTPTVGKRLDSLPLVACFNTATGTNASISHPKIGIGITIETLPSGAHQPLPLREGDVVVAMKEGRYRLFYTLGREASNRG